MKNIKIEWEKIPGWIYVSTVILIILVFYGRTAGYEFFIFDDNIHLAGKREINPLTWSSLVWIWTHSLMPVPYTVWGLAGLVFGTKNPIPYHLLSVFVYTVNVFLVNIWIGYFLNVYFLKNQGRAHSWTVSREKIRLAAMIGSIFFLLHPVHVEVTAWVSCLKDQLALMFALISFIFYFKSRNSTNKPWIQIILIIVFMFLSILSKATYGILPLAFIFLDIFLYKIKWKSILTYNPATLVPVFIFGIFYFFRISRGTFDYNIYLRYIVAIHSWWFYLVKNILPYNLNFDYGHTFFQIKKIFSESYPARINFMIFIFIACGTIFLKYKRIIDFAFLIFFLFLIFLLPHLGIVSHNFQNISVVSDRYSFLSSVVHSLVMSFAVLYIIKHVCKLRVRAFFFLAMAGYLAFFMTISFNQISRWKNSGTLLGHSLSLNPLSFPLNTAYGEYLWGRGRKKEALRFLLDAVIIKPYLHEALERLFMKYLYLKKTSGFFEIYDAHLDYYYKGNRNVRLNMLSLCEKNKNLFSNSKQFKHTKMFFIKKTE